MWDRSTGTPPEQAWYYGELLRVFKERGVGPLVTEFAAVVAELHVRAAAAPER